MRALVVAVIVLGTGLAHANGQWTERVDFRRSEQTSLKVVEPEGFKVTVTTDAGDKSGTAPEVFALANADAFVKVTITATDGASWTKKIEVRAGQQTQLAVAYTADTPKADKAGRTFVGSFAHLGGGCGSKWASTIKVELLRHADGAAAGTFQLAHKQVQQVQVGEGSYDVRVYKQSGADWSWVVTGALDVKKDGWEAGFGCKKGSSTPVIDTAP